MTASLHCKDCQWWNAKEKRCNAAEGQFNECTPKKAASDNEKACAEADAEHQIAMDEEEAKQQAEDEGQARAAEEEEREGEQ